MGNQTTVLLVDDHARLRTGLRWLLELEHGLTVIGEAGDGEPAGERLRELSPDVVVMEIAVPDPSAIEAIRALSSLAPQTRLLALSSHAETRFVESVLQAGATGYVLKECPPQELMRAIRAVARGDGYLIAALTRVALSGVRGGADSGETISAPGGPDEQKTRTSSLPTDGATVAEGAYPLGDWPPKVAVPRHVSEEPGIRAGAERPRATRANTWPGAEAGTPRSEHAAGGVLLAKLHRPALPDDFVVRPRLIERLERGRRFPLAVVSAGAGYGKSTLLASWLGGCACPSVWLSLDEGDNDLARFLWLWVVGVAAVFPDTMAATQAALTAPGLPPVPQLAHMLVNDLESIEEDFVLVLDDLHRLQAESVSELLAHVLQYPPNPLHLVLAGRIDPTLPLSSLRAHGRINELRSRDLRFTVAETAGFLEAALEVPVDGATARALEEATEGWPAALRLLALSSGRSAGPGPHASPTARSAARRAGVPVPRGSRKATGQDASLPPPDRHPRPVLPAAVRCVVPGGRRLPVGLTGHPRLGFVKWLQRRNVFVVPLDSEHRWFRYHHLFQQLLLNQLQRHRDPAYVAGLS